MQRQQGRQGLLHLAARNNRITEAMLQCKFCGLERFRQFFTDGSFDNTPSGKTNRCLRLCQNDIAQHGKARRDTAGRRVGQNRDTEHGIGCAGKTARQLKRQDYEIFDLLIGMDSANLRNIRRMCGGDEENKIHAMMDYTDRPGEVADPWYTGNFEDTWRDVNAGCRGLLEQLKREAL